jgi:anti-sigma-K factor RskA
MISHQDATELLGVYALDAVEGDELTELEEHLASCPRCRAELDGLREAAAALGNSVAPPPEGLWSRISRQLGDHVGEDGEPPPMPELTSGASERSPFRAPSPGWVRRNRATSLLIGSVAVAASVVAIVLGVSLVRSQNNVTNLQQAVARTPAEVALHTPGHQTVELVNSVDVELARFVIVPGGRGYLVSSSLPALNGGRTYQLWGITGTTPVSLGLLGASPHGSTFTIAGAPLTTKLALTAEPSGGSVTPTSAIVASGTV